jgi:hypothetical protein
MLISAAVSALVARKKAIDQGLPPGRYTALGYVLGSKPIGLAITLALENQAANQLPPADTGQLAQFQILNSNLPIAFQNLPYQQTLLVSGGSQPFTWNVISGQLPAGLILGLNTGAITGTPTSLGSFMLVVQATDKAGSTASQTFTISVASPVNVATSSLPSGTVGTTYAAPLTATGGTPPYTWSITSGMPAGLTLSSSTGIVSGTPTAAGSFNLTVQVTDSSGATASQSLVMTLSTTLTIVTTLTDAEVGTAYTETLTSTGGTGPFSWAVVQGILPLGLSLDPASGQISGTPTTAGSSNFTIQVTDAANATAAEEYGLMVTVPIP